MEYEVGDKVRIIHEGEALKHHYPIGKVVTVREVDVDGTIVCSDSAGWEQYVEVDCVEPYETSGELSWLPLTDTSVLKPGMLVVAGESKCIVMSIPDSDRDVRVVDMTDSTETWLMASEVTSDDVYCPDVDMLSAILSFFEGARK